MNITPPLGIGDLLLLKMKELSNDLTINQINVSYQLLTSYRKYPENYLPLIKNFIKLLFPETTICVTNEIYTLEYLLQYNIKNTYLYDHIHITIHSYNIHIFVKITFYFLLQPCIPIPMYTIYAL